MSQSERDSEEIKRLKEQLHKSFMQIEEMERLFGIEIEHTKEEMEDRERKIKQREEEVRVKYLEIEKSNKAKQSRFVMDIGDIDVSLEEIAYQKEDNLRDSGIESINSWLVREEQRKKERDPEYQMNRLQELETSIIESLQTIPNSLIQLFQISKELCLDNCRLKQQILNHQEAQEVFKMKSFDSERIIEKLKRSQKSLQVHNDQLNQLYGQEASQNAMVEEEIRRIKDEWNGSKIEIIDLKKQIQLLTQLVKTTNRIDNSKLNFNLPARIREQENGEREKPNNLRMSSNAVLIRHQKASTPMSQVPNESDAKTPNADSQQRYFKRRDRSEYMMSKKQQ